MIQQIPIGDEMNPGCTLSREGVRQWIEFNKGYMVFRYVCVRGLAQWPDVDGQTCYRFITDSNSHQHKHMVRPGDKLISAGIVAVKHYEVTTGGWSTQLKKGPRDEDAAAIAKEIYAQPARSNFA